MRIDYLGLEAFVAIAELRSFRRAAGLLNLSQTALSHRIRKIEAELGVQLLLRTTREVSLTEAGQDLLPQVRRHLNELATLYGDMREAGRTKQETVVFACLPTIANYHLPSVLHRFAGSFPEIAIQLHDQPVGRILDLVQSGEVEFGITIAGAMHPDLEVRSICTEPYILLVPHDHPLAARRTISRKDLIGAPMARITTQSTNRQLVDDAMGEYRDRLFWRYEVQHAATAMSLVAEGAALTVLPRLTAHLSGKALVALPFDDVVMERTLCVMTRRGVPLSDPARHLLQMITAQLKSI